MTQTCEEIHVYDGVAERTGVYFKRSDVRRSGGYCGSVAELVRKVRASGDGTFYLPLDAWPSDEKRVELLKPWVVMS